MHDAELHDHLRRAGVVPATFGVGWARLLLWRQFALPEGSEQEENECLYLWDGLTALGLSAAAVGAVVVAAVICARRDLLAGDSDECNALLVRTVVHCIAESVAVVSPPLRYLVTLEGASALDECCARHFTCLDQKSTHARRRRRPPAREAGRGSVCCSRGA